MRRTCKQRFGSLLDGVALLIVSCLLPAIAAAGPEGAEVVHGSAQFSLNGNYTTIHASDRAIINYRKFDIARPETVEFIQPSSTASVLNRILSVSPTRIDGTLLANGRVFFVNPAGIIFGPSAQVNVPQLIASALDISNTDFINGNYVFAGGSGDVVNEGVIRSEKAYLIARQVVNSGHIDCPGGYVILASGDRVFLGEPGSDVLVEVDVRAQSSPPDDSPERAAITNEGTIHVGSGRMVLAAAGDIYSQAIVNRGKLSASTAVGDAGAVEIRGTDGTVINSGSIEAKSAAGAGGTVKILGDCVGLLDNAHVDASGAAGGGTVLVGGDYQGRGDTPTASRTVVGPDAAIKADATENGDGGKVVVWSEQVTAFHGDIGARGGPGGGDGGLVEISSRGSLGFYGYVDASAPQGEVGKLLLDPTDLTVVDGAGPGSLDGSLPDVLFAEGGASETVAETALEALNANVILQATRDVIINNLTDNTLSLANLDTESLVIQAGRDITMDSSDTISTAGGAIHLEADSPHTGAAGAGDGIGTLTLGNITSGNGDITLIGADFVVSGTVDAGTGGITIGPSTNSALTLGTGGQLLDAELDNLTTSGALRIGEATTKGTDGAGAGAVTRTAASITIASDLSPANAGTLHLKTSGGVIATAGGVVVGNLAVEAGGPVNLTGAATDADTLAIRTSTGDIQYTDADGFSVGTVDGVAGVDTGNGSVVLTATTGNITVTDTGAANDVGATGAVALTALADEARITIAAGADVESTGGSHSYTADKMDISGTITATGQTVVLKAESTTDDDAIDLGSTVDTTANTLELADSELDNVRAATLVIGEAGQAGAMTVSAALSPANTSNLQLVSNSSVTINSTIDTLTAGLGGGLTITNAGLLDIAVGADLDLDGPFLQNGAGAVETAGDITTTGDGITFQGAVTLTDGHAVALSTGGGGGNIRFGSTLDGSTDFAEDLTLTAGTGNIDFDGAVGGTTDLGDVVIVSATDATINASFNANDITITASDSTIDINGDVTADGSLVLNNNTTVAADRTLKARNDLKMGAGKTLTAEGDLFLEATEGGITEDDGDGVFQMAMPAGGGTLTLTQFNALNMNTFNVANAGSTDLVATSSNGSITDTVADRWQSVTATAETGITLRGTNDITTNELTSSTDNITVRSTAGDLIVNGPINANPDAPAPGGGVSLISDTGKIYTPGDGDDTLNVSITGYSNRKTGHGVDLDATGAIEEAAIVIDSYEPLKLGGEAVLIANGEYDPDPDTLPEGDDRKPTGLRFDGPGSGDPIDIAIYLAARSDESEPGGVAGHPNKKGDITLDADEIHIAYSPEHPKQIGTLVVDARDTVDFLGAEGRLPSDKSNLHRIEVVSRVSETLPEAVLWNTLPYAHNPQGAVAALRDAAADPSGKYTYVLRGEQFTVGVDAYELGYAEDAPLPPIAYAPDIEDRTPAPRKRDPVAEVEKEFPGLLRPPIPDSRVAGSDVMSTDVSLTKVAERFLELRETLRSNESAAIEALNERSSDWLTLPWDANSLSVFDRELGQNPAMSQWISGALSFVRTAMGRCGHSRDGALGWFLPRFVGADTHASADTYEFVAQYLRAKCEPAAAGTDSRSARNDDYAKTDIPVAPVGGIL